MRTYVICKVKILLLFLGPFTQKVRAHLSVNLSSRAINSNKSQCYKQTDTNSHDSINREYILFIDQCNTWRCNPGFFSKIIAYQTQCTTTPNLSRHIEVDLSDAWMRGKYQNQRERQKCHMYRILRKVQMRTVTSHHRMDTLPRCVNTVQRHVMQNASVGQRVYSICTA